MLEFLFRANLRLPPFFLNTNIISVRDYLLENFLPLIFKFSVIIVFVIIAQSPFELTNEIDLEQVWKRL